MNKITVVLVLLVFILSILPHILTKQLIGVIRPFTTVFNVPRVIFRTHHHLTVCKQMFSYCHQQWEKLNPLHSIIWFDNNACNLFMKSLHSRIYSAYKTLKVGAYKADLFRACILYHYGGVYVDSYTTPFQSLAFSLLGCWHNSPHQFISVKDRGQWGIHNGFIVSTPKHPFLLQYITDIVRNVENRFYGKTDLDITGPRCLLQSINTVLNEKRKTYSVGWNKYGELSFYLFEMREGLYQPVYKQNELIMNKKYSLLHYITQKLFNRSTTYATLWRNKEVYK